MNTAWTKGLKRGSQEAKDVAEAYDNSRVARKRLIVMLNAMLEEETTKRLADSEYDSPSWAYRQADAIGYARAITKIINMLDDRGKNN